MPGAARCHACSSPKRRGVGFVDVRFVEACKTRTLQSTPVTANSVQRPYQQRARDLGMHELRVEHLPIPLVPFRKAGQHGRARVGKVKPRDYADRPWRSAHGMQQAGGRHARMRHGVCRGQRRQRCQGVERAQAGTWQGGWSGAGGGVVCRGQHCWIDDAWWSTWLVNTVENIH